MAVIPVVPVSGNTHLSADWAKLLEPGLRRVFYNQFDEIPEQYAMIYNVLSSSKAIEREYGLGGFKDWTARADELDTVAYQKISTGLDRTYVHEAFTSGFMVPRELYDDEQYRQIEKMASDLARAGRAKVEKDAISPLVNAFSANVGGAGKSAIYDGKALCANDHPLVDSVKVGDNLTTGALTEANLKAALLLMRETLGEAGNLVVLKPKKLIVAPALEHTARVILNTAAVPGSDHNDINTLKGILDLVVMDYLGSASTGTAATDGYWFIQADRHELNFFWRMKPEFKAMEEFDNFVAKYRGYMRYSYGVSDWRGIVGSAG
jgi:phage major head subunit gpT-like protein